MFLMFSSRHVKGEYQRLLKMFPANAENGGIHHAAHFFKNSDLDLHSFAAQSMLSNNIFKGSLVEKLPIYEQDRRVK